MQSPWIPLAKLDTVLQPDLLFLVLALAVSSWFFYRLFLKALSPERHRNLRGLFQNLLLHSVNLVALCIGFWALRRMGDSGVALVRLVPYLGLVALFWGCTVLVKTCRIIAFEYLFLSNMRAGVPLLIVNMLTLAISVLLGAWVLSGLFEFHVAPLLATSAAFSIVLGLAAQDTLGNMIAGIALQFDKPYEIGDWIEITNSGSLQKWVGQVYEITWRATILINTTEEWVIVPNRVMAQSEVSNFSARIRPFIRGHFFRIPFGADRERTKAALLEAAAAVPAIRRTPAPLCLMMETTESCIVFKLIYYIDDYGRQFVIGDELLGKAMANLASAGIAIAPHRIELEGKAA